MVLCTEEFLDKCSSDPEKQVVSISSSVVCVTRSVQAVAAAGELGWRSQHQLNTITDSVEYGGHQHCWTLSIQFKNALTLETVKLL